MRVFSGWLGWIFAIILLNAVPRIAIAMRHNPVLGISALVFDGFISGIAISPLLYIASTMAPNLILASLGITAFVFAGVTGYVMTSGRTFSAPRGPMAGLFFAVLGAMVLKRVSAHRGVGNSDQPGSRRIGRLHPGLFTSSVLSTPAADSAIPGALMLFAGVFNIFVATLNILLRLFGDGRTRRFLASQKEVATSSGVQKATARDTGPLKLRTSSKISADDSPSAVTSSFKQRNFGWPSAALSNPCRVWLRLVDMGAKM